VCDTLAVTERVDVFQVDDRTLQRRRSKVLVPAILATCVAVPLMALSVLFEVMFQVVLHSHAGMFRHAGTIYVGPSTSERVRAGARAVTPIVAGVVLLVLTWRFQQQGRAVATLVCAAGLLLMGVVSFW
jgi:hypothetical protein